MGSTSNLLNCCAYFSSKHIPQTLLKACLQQVYPELTDDTLSDIMTYTEEYSLLTFEKENQAVSIHNLVQAVIQEQLDQENVSDLLPTSLDNSLFLQFD